MELTIKEHIAELLLHHSCVVIPNFGGFVCSTQAAKIDYEKGKINPPFKAILFNRSLTISDGLMISSFANKHKLSFEEAQEKIAFTVAEWKKELSAGNRISFHQVGFLYLDNNKNIQFEQDRFYNLLLQSYGLQQVKFVPLEKATIEEKKVNQVTKIISIAGKTDQEKESEKTETIVLELPKSNKDNVLPKEKKPIWKYVAAAALIPIAFYSVWIPSKTNVLESGILSFQDFNPWHKKELVSYDKGNKVVIDKFEKNKSFDEQVESLPNHIESFTLEIENEDLNEPTDVFYVDLGKVQTNFTEQTKVNPIIEEVTKDLQISPNKGGKFKLIAGSFSNGENAKTILSDLQKLNISGFTEENKGLIRVIAFSSDDIAEVNEIQNKLKANNFSTWILK